MAQKGAIKFVESFVNWESVLNSKPFFHGDFKTGAESSTFENAYISVTELLFNRFHHRK